MYKITFKVKEEFAEEMSYREVSVTIDNDSIEPKDEVHDLRKALYLREDWYDVLIEQV